MNIKIHITIIVMLVGFFLQPLQAEQIKMPPYESSIQPLPKITRAIMDIMSWKQDCPTSFDHFAFLQITYWGFDGLSHQGVLIVDKKLAVEISQIFREIYRERFPISSVDSRFTLKGILMIFFGSNNTEAFGVCRPKTGTTTGYSWHSYGRAIDINPRENPYVKGSRLIPATSFLFLNRNKKVKGMITKNDVVYKAFTKRGWRWGGSWRTLKDYMHFEKPNS